MATVTATRAASTFPVSQFAGAGVLQAAYGSYVIASALSANDIIELCRLPKGATPLYGYIGTTDIDTGTEALDIDVGFAANGVDTADPDYFSNGGVFTGDNAITDFPFTNAVNVRLFTGPFPTVTTFGAETVVQAKLIGAAAAGGTGTVFVTVFYVVA